MTVQCCGCQKIRDAKGWRKPEEGGLYVEPVSHTYCPSCYAYFRLKVEQWKRRRSGRTDLS